MGRKGNKKNKGSFTIKDGRLRPEIMRVFRENPNKEFNYKQVSARLGLDNQDNRKRILQLMQEMVDIDLLEAPSNGKFRLHSSQSTLLSGTIDFTKSGAAYVSIAEQKQDVYIASGDTGVSLHGDTVEISIIGSKRGQLQGKVLRVIERNMLEFVGVLEMSKKHAFLVPSHQKIHTDFFIDQSKINGAKNGQKVVVKLLDWDDPERSPFGEVLKVLGEPGDHEVEMDAILAEFGLPLEFPREVVQEAENLDVGISDKEVSKRRDFRGIPTFTIDPDDARDFDDALSLENIGNEKFRIGVHIADVSHYVEEGSLLEKEALKRATSVYLVDRVVPMLPEILSNYVCSLRPDEDKLCCSAVFEMNAEGKILNQWFGKTVIHSKRRFTYDEAQKVIETGKGDFAEEISLLHNWAVKLRKERFEKGALEFSSREVKFQLDEAGKPIRVYEKVMKDANFLIEEFMLLANRRIAQYLSPNQEDRPMVYRVHDTPDPDKLKNLKDFVGRLGYKLPPISPENARFQLNKIMKQAKNTPEEDTIAQLSIRTMAKAEYTTENIGHYGLAFDYYTHFTSPIRRYPDILVHRILERQKSKSKSYSRNDLERRCRHSSTMERRAIEAERASIKYKQVEFMLDKIGDVFEGSITGLTRWGIFVELVDTKIEGMIPLNSLDDDVYRYDEKKNIIIGTRYKETFEFGDQLKVEAKSADLIMKQIEFRLV